MSSTSPSLPGVLPSTPQHVLVFEVENRRFALRLSAVEKVLPALEVTPWPRLPRFVAGVIDMHGQVLPVIRVQALLDTRLASAGQEMDHSQPTLSDHFIVWTHDDMRVVFWVERATEVVLIEEQALPKAATSRHEPWHPLKIGDDMTLLWDDDRIFDAEQIQLLRGLSARAKASAV